MSFLWAPFQMICCNILLFACCSLHSSNYTKSNYRCTLWESNFLILTYLSLTTGSSNNSHTPVIESCVCTSWEHNQIIVGKQRSPQILQHPKFCSTMDIQGPRYSQHHSLLCDQILHFLTIQCTQRSRALGRPLQRLLYHFVELASTIFSANEDCY